MQYFSSYPRAAVVVGIEDWLSLNGLSDYIPAFTKQHIEVNNLTNLDEDHLKELGLTVGHRLQFKKAVTTMLKEGSTPTSSPSNSIGEYHGEPLEYTCKVIIVGDQSTGKTSLIERYTRGTYDKGYRATIGVDFCLKDVRWNETTSINLQLWDIAGQERYANLTRMYYKEARGAFVVFDVSKERSLFDGAKKWKADIDRKVFLPNGDPIPVILLANKSDLMQTRKFSIDLDQFCAEFGFVKWFLTSAKDNFQVEEACNFLLETMLSKDDDFLKLSKSPKAPGLVVTNQNEPVKPATSGCCS